MFVAFSLPKCRFPKFLKVVGAVDTICDFGHRCKPFLEDLVEAASTGGNEAEVGALSQTSVSDQF